MFRNAFVVLSTLLAIATIPGAIACTNNACIAANTIYKECKLKATSLAEFKKCLCTKRFLVNYERCIGGTVCAWDGNPDTLNSPCILIYCPGTFDGGFDAKAYCAGRDPSLFSTAPPISTKPITRTIGPITRTIPIPPYSPIPIETGIA
ncbi:hypothetical protein FRC17_005966 [Serendipita sp. 399]|nr:hypothetical protein FRC17_005966 [Serendipita sp. 399]